ncbi:MAG: TRAP transporter substrate-binding protein DctP [Elusimicrobiota bacterium]
MIFSSKHAFAFAAGLLLWATSAGAAQIKFATMAPEGTDAMQVLREIDAEVQKETGGKLKFKFYSGGRQGEEKDVVRKIRFGQLHAGGFTGVGLGEIAPEVRILDAPWLLRDHEEVDHIYDKFSQYFEEAFRAKDYILLGWTEVGFIHVFSNTPVRSAQDMKKLKIWVWEGDPIAEAAFKVMGVHPIPLAVADVNTSLETGLIDAVYAAPYYAIALQWHEKTKYVYSVTMANASGAVLLSKKFFDRLPKDQQDILQRVSKKHLQRLNHKIREQNTTALVTLKKQGLKVTEPATPKELKAYEEAGREARRTLVGRLYSQDILDLVENALQDFRARRAAKKAKK